MRWQGSSGTGRPAVYEGKRNCVAEIASHAKTKLCRTRPNFVYKCDIMRHNFQAKHMKLCRVKQFHNLYILFKNATTFLPVVYAASEFESVLFPLWISINTVEIFLCRKSHALLLQVVPSHKHTHTQTLTHIHMHCSADTHSDGPTCEAVKFYLGTL